MSCRLDAPCVGPVRVVLACSEFVLRECFMGHSYREELPVLPPARGRFVDMPYRRPPEVRPCRLCQAPIEPDRSSTTEHCRACGDEARRRRAQACVAARRAATRARLVAVLEASGWDAGRAAARLHWPRTYMRNRMRFHGIEAPVAQEA